MDAMQRFTAALEAISWMNVSRRDEGWYASWSPGRPPHEYIGPFESSEAAVSAWTDRVLSDRDANQAKRRAEEALQQGPS